MTVACCIKRKRLLIKILNNTVPNTEPCAAPDTIFLKELLLQNELVLPLPNAINLKIGDFRFPENATNEFFVSMLLLLPSLEPKHITK